MNEIITAVVASVLLMIPLVFAYARSKVAKATALSDAEAFEAKAKAAEAETKAVEAQAKLAEAQRKAAEAQALADALTKGVEKITSTLPDDEAKKTKGAFTSAADDLGVGAALEATVGRLGFARGKSQAAIPTPTIE